MPGAIRSVDLLIPGLPERMGRWRLNPADVTLMEHMQKAKQLGKGEIHLIPRRPLKRLAAVADRESAKLSRSRGSRRG